jgi:hypothetical protein
MMKVVVDDLCCENDDPVRKSHQREGDWFGRTKRYPFNVALLPSSKVIVKSDGKFVGLRAVVQFVNPAHT